MGMVVTMRGEVIDAEERERSRYLYCFCAKFGRDACRACPNAMGDGDCLCWGLTSNATAH